MHTLPAGVEYVVAGSPAYHRVLARAKWLINNVNFPDSVRKRPGSVHVQTHHGTPVKVMGLDQQRYPLGAVGMDFAGLLRRVDRWDYSISANSFSTQMWERAYPAAYTTLEVGYPRNDRLVTATPEEVLRLRAQFGAGLGEQVVLYAPTHREHLPGYRPPFDPERVLDALGPSGLLLIRSHYFHDRNRRGWPPAGRDRIIDVSSHPQVEDLYLAADLLVTDYSSAMFDYAVLDRPIVIYAPDWDAYRLTRGSTSTSWPSRPDRWPRPSPSCWRCCGTGDSTPWRPTGHGRGSGSASAPWRTVRPHSGWFGRCFRPTSPAEMENSVDSRYSMERIKSVTT